jgi:hypothetical protein
MGTNCALLTELFLYLYEGSFIMQEFLQEKGRNESYSAPLMLRSIDNVFSFNNSPIGDYVDRIYPTELEIKNASNTTMSVSYLTVDLHIEIDSIKDWLTTIVYANRNDSNLPIVNFLCGNIPFPLAYNEVYISLC